MTDISKIQVGQNSYEIKDEKAARITHTHQISDIAGLSTIASDASKAKADASAAIETANAAKAIADDASTPILRIELSSVPANATDDTSQLTAHVYRGNELLSNQEVAQMGIVA